jgi:hypothetical protein
MTANDSQTPGRIPAPATRPRSGAEPQFGRVGIEFTSPNAGRVDDPARETLAPQGIRIRRGGGDPHRPVRPAERPVHSQPCRCARSVCWEQGRSAAWPMPFRPGIPPRFAVRTSGPACPPVQKAFPHQRVILRTTWPEAHETTGRLLRSTRPHETVCPDAARRRDARWRRDGDETVLPGGRYARRRSAHSAGHPADPPANPASSLLALCLESQGSPAGWRPTIDPAGPRGHPGGVHVRCRWRGPRAAGSARPGDGAGWSAKR